MSTGRQKLRLIMNYDVTFGPKQLLKVETWKEASLTSSRDRTEAKVTVLQAMWKCIYIKTKVKLYLLFGFPNRLSLTTSSEKHIKKISFKSMKMLPSISIEAELGHQFPNVQHRYEVSNPEVQILKYENRCQHGFTTHSLSVLKQDTHIL